MASIYDFKAEKIDGSEMDLSILKGKVVLIVNTASKCGLTPQFEGLQQLHERYESRGLTILGFPCNQFAGQDPAGEDEIHSFCQKNYGVTFQMMSKIKVNGKQSHPLYAYLRDAASGILGNRIKWNFTKFLISRDGESVERFAPKTEPEKLTEAIEKWL